MPSITFHPVVYANHKKEDGTYPVKIRVTFKRVSRKLPTTIFARKEDLTRSLTIKNAEINDKANDLIREMRSCLDDLNIFALEEMDVDQIVAHIKKRMKGDDFRLDFFAWAEEAIKTKGTSTAYKYRCIVKHFKSWIGKDSMDISEITPPMMREYEAFLRKSYGARSRALTDYPSGIAHIHALARRKYNNEMSEKPLIANPFEYYTAPAYMPPGHRDIDLSIIRTMYEERISLEGDERVAVDWFLISFMLMGVNMADLLTMEREKDGILHYFRQKTRTTRADNAEMFVRIEDVARPLIDEHGNDAGTPYQFDISRYKSKTTLANRISGGLTSWQNRHGLARFTYYAARHTWATTAYSCGINPAHITDALCHVDQGRKIDNIYIRKDWSIVWEANRKVLEYVFGVNKLM